MPQPGYEGFAALGEMLGGGIGTPGVYEDTLKKAYSVENALQDARRSRSLALIDAGRLENRQGITPELLQAAMAGDPLAHATLQANTLGSNQTVNLGQLADSQRPHYLANVNAAQDALGAGSIGDYNKFNAAAEGKSYQPTRVVGGVMMDDGASLGAGVVPLPQTQALIDQRGASGEAALIRANRAPASRGSGMSQVEADAKMNFIAAKATQMGLDGATPEYVNAWFVNEMAKAGLPVSAEVAGIEGLGEPVVDTAVPVPALGTEDAEVVSESIGPVIGLPDYMGGQRVNVTQQPAVGQVMDGYRYKGGDPGDPQSWEKI